MAKPIPYDGASRVALRRETVCIHFSITKETASGQIPKKLKLTKTSRLCSKADMRADIRQIRLGADFVEKVFSCEA